MSAPDTNIARQKTRHRPALWGLWGGFLLAVLLTVILTWVMSGEEVAAAIEALKLVV